MGLWGLRLRAGPLGRGGRPAAGPQRGSRAARDWAEYRGTLIMRASYMCKSRTVVLYRLTDHIGLLRVYTRAPLLIALLYVLSSAVRVRAMAQKAIRQNSGSGESGAYIWAAGAAGSLGEAAAAAGVRGLRAARGAAGPVGRLGVVRRQERYAAQRGCGEADKRP